MRREPAEEEADIEDVTKEIQDQTCQNNQYLIHTQI